MLLKALFILTTETNYKYNFEPYVNENGNLELEYVDESHETFKKNNGKNRIHTELDENNDNIITTRNLADFVDKQVELQKLRKTDLEEEIVRNEEILKELKEYVKKQNDIYVMQEKQIVMFLDCKKSFLKKYLTFLKLKSLLCLN